MRGYNSSLIKPYLGMITAILFYFERYIKLQVVEKNGGDSITIGYVFIDTIPEKEHEVYNSLLNKSRVVKLTPIFEDTDFELMAEIEMRDHKKLRYYVLRKIQSLDGVIDTKIYC